MISLITGRLFWQRKLSLHEHQSEEDRDDEDTDGTQTIRANDSIEGFGSRHQYGSRFDG